MPSSIDNRDSRVLIVGASARAAAASAVRAGMNPFALDLFNDVDLRGIAESLSVTRYPHGLPELARQFPRCPWIYTGGLENHPQVIAAISADRPLWGNPPEVVRRVRDPMAVFRVLRSAGLPAAEVRTYRQPPEPNGQWLLKPTGSAGGRGIRVWTAGGEMSGVRRQETEDRRHESGGGGQGTRNEGRREGEMESRRESPMQGRGDAVAQRISASACLPVSPSLPLMPDYYFQQRVSGRSMSAVFVGADRAAQLIGITRQFVGTRVLHAPPFGYCGTLGPCPLPKLLVQQVDGIGAALVREFPLRGLFGVDFVFDGQAAWLTEVNPRYTASVEVLEHSLNVSLLDAHCRACQWSEVRGRGSGARMPALDRRFSALGPSAIVAKAILFAPCDVVVPDLAEIAGFSRWRSEAGLPNRTHRAVPLLADIPEPGTKIRAGRPVCTVLAAAANATGCLRRLTGSVRDVSRLISTKVYS